MAVTVTTSPEYPIPKSERAPKASARLSFSCSGGGDFVRVFVTDAPPGSEYRRKLDASGTSQIQIHSGNAADTFELSVDKGGKYTLSVQEIAKGAAAYGGGYSTAPDGHQTETLIGTTATAVSFGSRLSMQVGNNEDKCTLVTYAWEDTFRETTVAIHGEKSPALISPSSPRARNAALHADVVTALAALIDVDADVALTALGTVINDLRAKINAHLVFGVHVATDTVNTIGLSFSSTDSPKGAADGAAETAKKLRLHMQTDAGTGVGTGTWHKQLAIVTADLKNLQIADTDTRRPGLLNLVADVWRAYEAHRVNTTAHAGSSDTTNTATALPQLLNLCRHFFAALATASPTAPATENGAVTYLVQNAGMTEG